MLRTLTPTLSQKERERRTPLYLWERGRGRG